MRIQLIGFNVKYIYFWSQNHTGCRRYCSKFLGNSNFSIRAPSLKYLSIFVAFIEYHSNIDIPNTWVWANTRKAQVFHHSATSKVPKTLISFQLKLLNSGKNFGQVHFYTWVNLLQWKSVFVGSQFLQQHQKLLLRKLSWNFSNENCFQFYQPPET